MPVPPFQEYLDPVLSAVSDGAAHPVTELASFARDALELSPEDLREMVPSGTRSRHQDRTYWAVTYLFQAGLLERPARGVLRITDRGRAVLAHGPRPIGPGELAQFPEFQAFQKRRTPAGGQQDAAEAADITKVLSPVEEVAELVDSVNDAVASDLLTRIIGQPPEFLERVVLLLLGALGYGGLEATAEHLGGPGDEGLDGVIRQDVLGLDVVYVQAKRYAPERKVGRPDIQAFVGALTGAQANRGVFITTSAFTPEAKTYAERVGLRLVLIDGKQLARLMMDRNVGVGIQETYHLKRIDENFFEA